ncbi:exopolysaccharide biosynthesis polyprenyl glycosylphosphotransferase [Silvibacterium bohemicum]|uniref:Exopolysaccharide biosynthesis polyprenyl glycosylphosphotransferase n=1 Tax=Silvibacterium bohemicum TaxID=1577686 RepID=A0A841JN59_9BACT|nr:sugar transferase [Silvibacterium bohemicum]MBB6142812.1 exopolysaccharide biosynthesis polyprenyl glycosylphosphotransferase [Silvibacterium bohemicum]
MATVSLGNLSRQKSFSGKAGNFGAVATSTSVRASLTTLLMMFSDVFGVLFALVLALNIGLERVLGTGSSDLWRVVGPKTPLSWELGYLACFVVALLLVNYHQGLYGHTLGYSALYEQRRTVQSGLIAGLLLCGALYSTHNTAMSRAVVFYFIALSTAFTCITRGVWRFLMFRRYERGVDASNVVILGATGIGMALHRQIVGNRHLGRVFKGFVHSSGNSANSKTSAELSLGTLDQLRYLARQHFIDEIIIAEPCSMDVTRDLIDLARELKLEILVIPGFYDGITPEAPIEYVGDFPVVAIHRRDEKVAALFLKRVSDVVLSCAALFVSLPVLLTVAVAIKLDSPGPVLYLSERIGKKGRVFRCFKFRTMVADAEKRKQALVGQNERTGILFKMKNDPRITRVGAWLRKYSLDEIPQFLNVLRGDMSLVGPRPPLATEVEKYELEHFRRLEVLPGLTGLWQVRARQDPSFERYVALDLAYVENWSLWLDLKILVHTAEVVFRGTGC